MCGIAGIMPLTQGAPDLRGLNHYFTFLAVPGPVACFKGVEALMSGHYLTVQADGGASGAQLSDKVHWEIDLSTWATKSVAGALPNSPTNNR